MENKSVILNKFETIEKCINRINEEYQNNPENLDDYRKMDMIVLNIYVWKEHNQENHKNYTLLVEFIDCFLEKWYNYNIKQVEK